MASDAEAILGIGDWGVGGIDISIGKLAVYTVAAGIDPRRVLAVGLDVGTNREELLNDPRYLGLRRSRVRGEAYDAFIDAYVASASARFPKAILHWEDFSGPPARGILARYGDTLCTFDDDIQGTAAVGLACVLAGVRVSGGRLIDQQIVVFGAGSAGVGIADLIALAMTEDGLSAQEAADRIFLLDRPGLLTSDMTDLYDYQQPYAKDPATVAGWRAADGTLGLQEVVDNLHPTMLVGTSGVTGAFSEKVIRSMHANCPRPIILPMSNPTVLAEQTPTNLLAWTDGAALVATGSPFGPVERDGTTYRIGQANNALMFPGLGLGRDRLPRRDDAALTVHRRRPRAGEARRPDGSRQGPAAGHLPAARGLGHRRRRRDQHRDRPGHRPGAGRRPDRGGARSDVEAGVPPDRALATAPAPSTGADMAQTVAEILVDQMVEVGIRKVYGIVGDSANPIVDALRRHEADIEFVHVRNEEAGAFAAGADAQVSGRPTAVLGSSGPGSLHLLNGLYDCQRNAAPVFAIATHIPSTEIGSDYFQETNPEPIFSGCTQLLRPDLHRRPDAAHLRARAAGGHPGARRRHGDPARGHRRPRWSTRCSGTRSSPSVR